MLFCLYFISLKTRPDLLLNSFYALRFKKTFSKRQARKEANWSHNEHIVSDII